MDTKSFRRFLIPTLPIHRCHARSRGKGRLTVPIHAKQKVCTYKLVSKHAKLASKMMTAGLHSAASVMHLDPSFRVAMPSTYHAQKQKQQYGPGAGGAVNLDPELEAAYEQFGRALGEAPRETARIVQSKIGSGEERKQQSSSQAAVAARKKSPQQRCVPSGSLSDHITPGHFDGLGRPQ